MPFVADSFEIIVFCDSCGRSAPLEQVPESVTIQKLVTKLRCSACGSREASIRIVYTGSGGFKYGATTPTTCEK